MSSLCYTENSHVTADPEGEGGSTIDSAGLLLAGVWGAALSPSSISLVLPVVGVGVIRPNKADKDAKVSSNDGGKGISRRLLLLC